jgi:hypothetical protein
MKSFQHVFNEVSKRDISELLDSDTDNGRRIPVLKREYGVKISVECDHYPIFGSAPVEDVATADVERPTSRVWTASIPRSRRRTAA